MARQGFQTATFGDHALARRLEGDEDRWSIEWAKTYARLYPDSGTATEAIGSGHAVFAGVGSFMSQAKGLGMDGPLSPEDLDRLDDFYRSRGCPAKVVVCPLADPSLLEIGRRGYRVLEFENVLARSLTGGERLCDESPMSFIGEGVVIRAASQGEEELWARTSARGFFGDGDAVEAFLPIFRSMAYLPGASLYLAWIGGEPVGAAGLGVRDGLGGIFGASTLPSYRRRGVHGALIGARLAAAREAGCDLAWVGAKPASDSQRNLERFRFRTVYTKANLIREWESRGGSTMPEPSSALEPGG